MSCSSSRGILSGLEFLDSKKILHRDLKPENILISSDDQSDLRAVNFKICDFGLATYQDGASLYKRCGTPGYVSPEIVKSDPDDASFKATCKCDTFSAGVILYLLLSRPPSRSGQHAFPVV